jgi:hypothetical protein
MPYNKPFCLDINMGNNSLSYQQRKKVLWKAEIRIPSLVHISSINQISLSDDIRIEEIDDKWTLHSCTWLAHIYHLRKQDLPSLLLTPTQSRKKGSEGEVYIFDNHNHALYYRLTHLHHKDSKSLPYPWEVPRNQAEGVAIGTHKKDQHISLIHIDQHSDLNTPPISFNTYINNQTDVPLDQGGRSEATGGFVTDKPYSANQQTLSHIRTYTNHHTQISTFIKPFLELYPQTEFTRIKSESQLLSCDIPQKTNWHSPLTRECPEDGVAWEQIHTNSAQKKREVCILDIDLDFRAPQMSIEKFDETISITRQYITQADLVTIATSPTFIDQTYALKILAKLLTWSPDS